MVPENSVKDQQHRGDYADDRRALHLSRRRL
jgi:hypothetical protein